MAVDIIINGALGRMGKELAGIVLLDEEVQLIGCIEKAGHPATGSDIGDHLCLQKTKIPIGSSFKDIPVSAAVVIDFTTPSLTRSLLKEVKGTEAGIVIGTTGLTDNDMELMREVSKTNGVLFSPNMCLGINFLFYLTQVAAKRLGKDFDIEIIETHHKFKKDSPSGTAKVLGEIVSKAIGCSDNEAIKHGRVGFTGERSPQEVGMHSVRGGDIVGDHTVLFAGTGERLELKHMAHSRVTFAKGAVKAAKWLHSKGPGLYSMRDVLGF